MARKNAAQKAAAAAERAKLEQEDPEKFAEQEAEREVKKKQKHRKDKREPLVHAVGPSVTDLILLQPSLGYGRHRPLGDRALFGGGERQEVGTLPRRVVVRYLVPQVPRSLPQGGLGSRRVSSREARECRLVSLDSVLHPIDTALCLRRVSLRLSTW